MQGGGPIGEWMCLVGVSMSRCGKGSPQRLVTVVKPSFFSGHTTPNKSPGLVMLCRSHHVLHVINMSCCVISIAMTMAAMAMLMG